MTYIQTEANRPCRGWRLSSYPSTYVPRGRRTPGGQGSFSEPFSEALALSPLSLAFSGLRAPLSEIPGPPLVESLREEFRLMCSGATPSAMGGEAAVTLRLHYGYITPSVLGGQAATRLMQWHAAEAMVSG